MKEREVQRKGRKEKGRKGKGRVWRPRPLRIPPPDSTLWPEQYRGERWKRAYGILFAGKCQLCAYSFPLSKWRQGQDRCTGMPRLLLCTNSLDSPGELVEVLPVETCRNFKPKSWRQTAARAAAGPCSPAFDETDPTVRRIRVGDNLFATVDARDYKRLNQYKWYACGHGRTVYAVASIGGKMVLMHRMIMRPRKGYVVHHIDGNGLNNRRCNLRECTAAQNRVSRRPRRPDSGYVGVQHAGKKWAAGITYRGQYYYLGVYDDPVAAAKARDRKAYELHGDRAYLNFPQDYPGYHKHQRRKRTNKKKAKAR